MKKNGSSAAATLERVNARKLSAMLQRIKRGFIVASLIGSQAVVRFFLSRQSATKKIIASSDWRDLDCVHSRQPRRGDFQLRTVTTLPSSGLVTRLSATALLCLSLFVLAVAAQAPTSGTITGRVHDNAALRSLERARVT